MDFIFLGDKVALVGFNLGTKESLKEFGGTWAKAVELDVFIILEDIFWGWRSNDFLLVCSCYFLSECRGGHC